MARPLRFQYPGAVYHVMARGDGGKFIFKEREECLLFLNWLEKVCGSHGWRVHAWVLMGNHFHLLLETPEANLVSGMRLLLGAYGQAWNRRHRRKGHVFQGRYKSVPVSGERATDSTQFRVVADYIHLNPARARIVGGSKGKLVDYPWSSLKSYSKGSGPSWLVRERVLKAFELAKDGRGRRAYIAYLEERAITAKGKLSPDAMDALRRGWYLGDEGFRDQLLSLMDARPKKLKRGSHDSVVLRSHGEKEAKRIVKTGLRIFELEKEDLAQLRKSDSRKVAIATVLKSSTEMNNLWIVRRLEMGHERTLSRQIRTGMTDGKTKKMAKLLSKVLLCAAPNFSPQFCPEILVVGQSLENIRWATRTWKRSKVREAWAGAQLSNYQR